MDQYGEQVELYEHYGKVILLDLSAMWCGPCNMIAPYGEQWVQRLGEENFIWITVLLEDTNRDTVELSDLQVWATTHGITLPVLAGSRDMIDLTEPLEDGYPVTSWPTLVVIDRGMTLQHGINGWNEAVITSWVEGLL
jgi:thiol-disulfide isomerase/thioredoxin